MCGGMQGFVMKQVSWYVAVGCTVSGSAHAYAMRQKAGQGCSGAWMDLSCPSTGGHEYPQP